MRWVHTYLHKQCKICIIIFDIARYFSMDSNTQKEEFSYAYIYAVAATAGYAIQRANTPLDQIGIDLTIAAVGQQGL